MRKTIITASLLTALLPVMAHAQSGDLVVMRKAIEPRNDQAKLPWLPEPNTVYHWSVDSTDPVPQGCGPVKAAQHVTCRDDRDQVARDSFCSQADRPAASLDYTDYRACTYSWTTPAWSPWDSTCSDAATRTRSVQCLRSDGKTVPDGSCDQASRPASSETQAQTQSCTYAWRMTDWSPYDSTCSDAATRTRAVTCERSDGRTVDGAQCGGSAPASSETVSNLSSCTYAWTIDKWTDAAPTCGTAIRSATDYCARFASPGGTPLKVADDQCANLQHPVLAQSYTDISGCTYSWQQDVWSAWSSNCSDAATRTRTAYCVQSDGTKVADTYCKATKPAPVTETSGQYSGCTARWVQLNAVPALETCPKGTIGYSTYVACVDASGKTISSSLCTGNSALKQPSSVKGTASCSVRNSWQGAPLGYSGVGYTAAGVMAVSYPGKLTQADALAKAISQCETYAYQSASNYHICQYNGFTYYPSVNRTYVEASPPGVSDPRSESPPSNTAGAVYTYQYQWQWLNTTMDLYSSDVSFTLKGWSATRNNLNSGYGFYMDYSIK